MLHMFSFFMFHVRMSRPVSSLDECVQCVHAGAPLWQSSWLGQVDRTSAALPPVGTGTCLSQMAWSRISIDNEFLNLISKITTAEMTLSRLSRLSSPLGFSHFGDSQWAKDAMSSLQQLHCIPFKARDSQVIAFQWLWQLSPPETPEAKLRTGATWVLWNMIKHESLNETNGNIWNS